MKKKLLFMVCIALLLCACGNNEQENQEPTKAETSTEQEVVVEKHQEVQEPIEPESGIVKEEEPIEKESEEENNNEVDIIMMAFMFDNNGIDSYIEMLQENDPDGKYKKYDDMYYIETITEKERKEVLKDFKDSQLKETYATFDTDDAYGGCVLNIKEDKELQNFEVYVDSEIYKQNEFECCLGIEMLLKITSETYQAYNLIEPSERITNVKIIDNTTGEVLN